MHLVLVPRVQAQDPEGGPRFWRPSLPASLDRAHGWGQASSVFEPDGKVLCWVRATAAELDEIAALPGARVGAECCVSAESDRMVAAMRSADLKSARDEFVAAYRAPAAAEERQRGIAHAVHLAVTTGLIAGALWLASFLSLDLGAALGLVVLHSDNFNRANENLGASGMSDGLGAWTIDSGTWTVTSNAARGNNGVAYDSAMADYGDQKATCTTVAGTGKGGPLIRRPSATNFYFCRSNQSTTLLQMFKRVAGADTQLGSNGSAVINGDVLAIEAAGTSLTSYLNGGADIGPATDSAHATGKAGLISVNAVNRDNDDWQVEIDAAGQPIVKRFGGAPFMGGGPGRIVRGRF